MILKCLIKKKENGKNKDKDNEKEKNWNAITKNIIVFKVNNDINEKVKKLYEKVEKEIDELTNIKRPFCLEKKELEFIDKICGISKEDTLIKNEEEENERMKESQILKERTEKQMKNKKEKEMLEKKEIKSIQDSSDDSESDSILSSEEENKKRNPGKRKTGNGKKEKKVLAVEVKIMLIKEVIKV